jgi:hypothetical protein
MAKTTPLGVAYSQQFDRALRAQQDAVNTETIFRGQN